MPEDATDSSLDPTYINPEECHDINQEEPVMSDDDDADGLDNDADRAEQYGHNDEMDVTTESDEMERSAPDESDISTTAHGQAALCVAICPTDPNLMVTGGQDDVAILWRVSNNKLEKLRTINDHSDSVVMIQFSNDGKYFATASYDGLVKVWDCAGELVQSLEGPSQEVEWIAWHPKGHALLAGSTDATAWMWWAPTGKVMQVFAGHGSAVSCGGFGKGGQVIATASLDGSVVIWNPREGVPFHTFKNIGEGGVISLDCHPSEPIMVVGCEDGSVHVLHMEKYKTIQQFNSHSDCVEAVKFFSSPSQNVIATAALDGHLNVWDANRFEKRCEITDNNEAIIQLRWHPAGLPFACTCSTDNSIRWFDIRNGQQLKTLNGHLDGVLDIAVTCFQAGDRTMTRVASVSDDRTLKIWNLDLN